MNKNMLMSSGIVAVLGSTICCWGAALLTGVADGLTGTAAWLHPPFMLTYRNVALRGGVEFGLADAQYIEKPETNYKIILEWHL